MASGSQTRPKYRWHKRTLIVAAILFVIAGGYVTHRVIRRQWLLAELDAVSARATRDSLVERLRRWKDYGDFDREETEVNLLNANIDDDWLLRHDFLRDLEIEDLSGCNDLSSRALTGLINSHPLRRLDLFNRNIPAEVVDALHSSPTIAELVLQRSDLSDDGLATLPLEQIKVLHIQTTNVTSDGLMHLKRCRELEFVSIDRSQLSEDAIDLLASLGTVETVGLSGEDITDQDLMRLVRIPTLTGCSLENTSVTEEGIDAFMAAIRAE